MVTESGSAACDVTVKLLGTEYRPEGTCGWTGSYFTNTPKVEILRSAKALDTCTKSMTSTPEAPMSEPDLAAVRAAIVKLSDCVGDIAFRCHEQLGTTESARIQQEMNVLGEAFHE